MKNSTKAVYGKCLLLCLLGLAALLIAGAAQTFSSDQDTFGRDRFYIGVAGCRKCHIDHDGGRVFSSWHLSAHARAYAVLSLPEAKEIARLSGLPTDIFESPVCLGCHATASNAEAWELDPSFFREDGVQCELCHGPGSDYANARTMADREAAKKAGLLIPGEAFCMQCHQSKGSHQAVLKGKEFDYKSFLDQIRHKGKALLPDKEPEKTNTVADGPLHAGARACAGCHNGRYGNPSKYETMLRTLDHSTATARLQAGPRPQYKTPMNLALSHDGKRLYVSCEASDSVVVVNTEDRTVIAEIGVGSQPNGICLSPDERRVLVSNRGSDTVSVIDPGSNRVVDTIKVGDEPHGLVTDLSGNMLYVANAGSHDISVVDLRNSREVKRLAAGRGAWGVSRSADGSRVLVTNSLPQLIRFRTPLRSEVTVINTETAQVENRVMLEDANMVQGIGGSPDGEYTLVTLMRTKNLVPMTRVLQGWVVTNGIGILWKDGRVDQLLLDEPENYFADPTDVAVTPDGRYAYVSGGGVSAVAVIDLARMKKVLDRASDGERKTLLPNHQGIATEYVVKRIGVGSSPRGLAVSADGRYLYVADALDDAVSVIDAGRNERTAVIDLKGPKELTLERYGERIFHSAGSAFGSQFSCRSCHPDGGADGITYDLEPDGLGVNPVDNRSLRGILDTAPFKWTGTNPTLSRQCGPRLAVFFNRADPFTPAEVKAVERYICTIPMNPNRYSAGKQLSPAQRRGKVLFARTHTNAGKEIPEEKRCISCHAGPYYTNRKTVDVGTRSPLDTQGSFDVPHLTNIYESAPYLHDGRSATLEEIWTRYNPQDTHGVTNDMTKNQLNDLIEYLKRL